MRSVVSDSELEQGKEQFPMPPNGANASPGTAASLLWKNKSSLSAGHRFHAGRLVQTSPLPGYGPPECAIPQIHERTYIFEGILAYFGGSSSGKSVRRGSTVSSLMGGGGSYGTGLWESMQFWEDVFCGNKHFL